MNNIRSIQLELAAKQLIMTIERVLVSNLWNVPECILTRYDEAIKLNKWDAKLVSELNQVAVELNEYLNSISVDKDSAMQ
jgi:hypothetical protein